MRISVVIPVLEDRAVLGERKKELRGADEVIVVDASRVEPVRREDLPPGARLLRSAQVGRASQQNLGAAAATGEGILFLHADTHLPAGAIRAVRAALEDAEAAGGGFARFFDSPSRFLRWSCRWGRWRSRRWGWFLGDQAIFVRRRDFVAVGGFRALALFEDYDLCRRLKKRGRMVCLRAAVLSSARRFARRGPLGRSVRDFLLTAVYLVAGTGPFRMIQNVEIKSGPDPRTPC